MVVDSSSLLASREGGLDNDTNNNNNSNMGTKRSLPVSGSAAGTSGAPLPPPHQFLLGKDEPSSPGVVGEKARKLLGDWLVVSYLKNGNLAGRQNSASPPLAKEEVVDIVNNLLRDCDETLKPEALLRELLGKQQDALELKSSVSSSDDDDDFSFSDDSTLDYRESPTNVCDIDKQPVLFEAITGAKTKKELHKMKQEMELAAESYPQTLVRVPPLVSTTTTTTARPTARPSMYQVKQIWEGFLDSVARFPGAKDMPKIDCCKIFDNINRVALHLDMDGTLTAAGQPLGQRAVRVIKRLQALGVPVSCNTAQSHKYLLAAGGEIFTACVNEMGLRVQHNDGSIETSMPPRFGVELETAQNFLKDRPHYKMVINEKAGGFAIKFSDRQGNAAEPEHVQQIMDLVKELAAQNEELTVVRTDGFVDLCSAILSKRFGAQMQMKKAPFRDCFAIGAGDGVTDERMFEVCDLSIKVGREDTRASARLGDHDDMLDVLEWIAEIRDKQHALRTGVRACQNGSAARDCSSQQHHT